MKYFGIPLVLAVTVALAIAEPEHGVYITATVTRPKNKNQNSTATSLKKTVDTLRQSRCYSSQFECTSGECVNKKLICDGRRDCRDGSDESFQICFTPGGQTSTTTTTRRPSYPNGGGIGDRGDFTCSRNEFLCTSGECINQRFVCDGQRHCSDGSDELSTICPASTNGAGKQCLSTEFRCKTGECIFGGYRCDGVVHCPDRSDEDWSICQTVAEQQPDTPRPPTRIPNPNQGGTNVNTGNNVNTGISVNTGNNVNTGISVNTGNNVNTGNIGGNTWERRLTPCNVPAQPANGRWRLHRSLCDSNVECNAPLDVRSMEPGSYLVYSCDQGFIINGASDVLCGPGGQWINTPRCDEIRCTDLSSSTLEAHCVWNNVAVSCEVPAPIDTIAELKCRKGFVQEVMYEQSYRRVKCQSDGKWSPKPITCVKKPKKVKLVLEGDMILQD